MHQIRGREGAVIVVKDLHKHYGPAGKTQAAAETLVRALDGVSVEVQPGEFTAIVGPSGSGKSTLLHLIGGLDRPTSGNVELGGQKLEALSDVRLSDFRRDHIGFIFQSYNLIPVLTAAENVEYVLLLQKVPAAERRARVNEVLAKVGLQGLEHRRPPELSGGQQQRVAVARALVSRPDLILADEPTANLDSHTGASLLDMMKELNEREGVTFVFSTHDPKIMERARRIVTLRDGRVETDESRG